MQKGIGDWSGLISNDLEDYGMWMQEGWLTSSLKKADTDTLLRADIQPTIWMYYKNS